MLSQSLAADPHRARGLILATAGLIIGVAALNAAANLSAMASPTISPAAAVAPPAVIPAPAAVAAPPPPAFVFDAPLPGRHVNSPFGLRQLPWEENGRLHEGVDIAAPNGSPVRAAADGVVLRSGQGGAYGRFVEVAHKNGFRSLYAHLGRGASGLRPGAWVARGATIGFVGNSGRSTGAHLHFELRREGRPLNPDLFLGRSFAEADDLPLRAAARVPRGVRLATVSQWPKGVKADRDAGAKARRTRAGDAPIQMIETAEATPGSAGRARARIQWLARPAPAAAPESGAAAAPVPPAPPIEARTPSSAG